MALKDLYGIGKGEAQVFDTDRVSQLLAEKRAVDRKAHADKLAKDAVKKATLGKMLNDLNAKGAHEKDMQYLGDRKKDITDWYKENTLKYGETAIHDTPELYNEFISKINDYKSDVEWSQSSVANRKKMLDQTLKTRDEVNMDDVGSYQHWSDQDFVYRRTHAMPTIRNKEISRSERIKTKGYSGAIEKMRKKVKRSVPIGDGKQRNVEGYVVDETKFNNYIDNLAKNSDDPLRNDIWLDAAIKVEQEEGLSPNDPKFPERQQAVGRELLEAELRPYIGEVGVGGFTVAEPGADTDDDEPTVLVKGGQEEKKLRRQVKEEIPSDVKQFASNWATGSDGKTYYKMKEISDLTAKKLEEKTGQEFRSGQWYELGTNKPKDLKDQYGQDIKLGEKYTVEDVDAGEPYFTEENVSIGNVGQVEEYIDKKGYLVKAKPGTGIKKGTTNKIRYNVNYNVADDGKMIFEGEEGYDEAQKKTDDFVTVTGTGLKGFTEAKITKSMLKNSKKLRDVYNAGKADVQGGDDSGMPKEGDEMQVQGGTAVFNGTKWVMKK